MSQQRLARLHLPSRGHRRHGGSKQRGREDRGPDRETIVKGGNTGRMAQNTAVSSAFPSAEAGTRVCYHSTIEMPDDLATELS